MRLARDSAKDEIHDATPGPASEGGDIRPHRRVSQETLQHRFDQMGGGECFPLHDADRASAWDCQFDSEVETSASGAEADAVEAVAGMYSHISPAPG
jgi:hypothetical protein